MNYIHFQIMFFAAFVMVIAILNLDNYLDYDDIRQN